MPSDSFALHSPPHPTPLPQFTGRLLIDGAWRDGQDGARISRDSPAHGVTVSRYARAEAADATAAVAAARRAFDEGPWPRLPAAERAALLTRVAALIEDRCEALALRETLETGKPISQARNEVSWSAELWRYAAAAARHLAGESHNGLGADMLALVLREPVGVVSIITPWNFPLLIVSQKLPFALAAGCCCVVKPSELTSGTTLMLGEILLEAGMPAGVVNILTGAGAPVGQIAATHPAVDMLSFTGSTAVGKTLAAAAAGTLKKVSLELGGKNPQIVFPDCDWDAAIDAVVFGTYFNAGQCCNSGSRLLVHADIADDFVAQVVAQARKLPVGDPLAAETKIGAIVSAAHLDKIEGYVGDAQTAGAALALGGRAQRTPGRFMEATVLDGVQPQMAVAREEVFGPVLSVLRFDSLEAAIRIANDSLYGLSAGVWSASYDTCLAIARQVRAGTVWLNTWMDGYPELPFGGYGESGSGRELGRYGTEEFTELKTVQMHMGPRTNWWVPR